MAVVSERDKTGGGGSENAGLGKPKQSYTARETKEE